MRLLFLLLIGAMSGLYAAVGQIAALNGQATIERDDRQLPARIGFELEERDRVMTGKKSRLQLILDDDTTINLGPNSDLAIEAFLYHEEAANPQVKLRATKGTFRAITGQISRIAPESFSMQTKTATIGIRGTHFQGSLGEMEAIGCTRGAIGVRGEDGTEVLVRAGQMTTIAPGQSPSTPKALALEELESQEEESAEPSEEEEATGEEEEEATTPEELEEEAIALIERLDDEGGEELVEEVTTLITQALDQQSSEDVDTDTLMEGFELSALWGCAEEGCDFESFYFDEGRSRLSVPGDSASSGHNVYEPLDGYRISGYKSESDTPSEPGFETELFAADESDEFILNLRYKTWQEDSGELMTDMLIAYEGVRTQAGALQDDTVLTWDMLVWSGLGRGGESWPWGDVDVFLDRTREETPLLAANTANEQVMLLHPDGASFGQLKTASDGTLTATLKDYSIQWVSDQPVLIDDAIRGDIFGSNAQGFGFTSQNDRADGSSEYWAGGGYASEVDNLSGGTPDTGSFELTGHTVTRTGGSGEVDNLSGDRATGELTAELSLGGGDVQYVFSGQNSDLSAAYISDGLFGVLHGGTQGYLAAVPLGGSSEVVSWGVWDVAETEYIEGGVWVAGKAADEAQTYLQETLMPGGGQHTYSGHVMGSTTDAGDILFNENNQFSLTFDFSQGTITEGSISFDAEYSSGWSDTVAFGGLDGGQFNGSFDGESGTLQGRFYGSEAQGAGGSFSLTDAEHGTASGVFKATRE